MADKFQHKMADLIPVFPLEIVVFPGETLNLHIFEPRYKQLINECSKTGNNFAIVSFIAGSVAKVATEVSLLSIEKTYENGEMDIKIKGTQLLQILEFFPKSHNRLYPGAEIISIKEKNDEDPSLSHLIIEKMTIFYSALGINKPIPDAVNFRNYQVAHHLGLNLEQEYELLCITSEIERQKRILNHIERVLPVIQEVEKIKKRALLNGQFQSLIPPELQ